MGMESRHMSTGLLGLLMGSVDGRACGLVTQQDGMIHNHSELPTPVQVLSDYVKELTAVWDGFWLQY